MEQPSWVPEGVDVTVPSAARIYDYALGGSHNFAVDREALDRVEQLVPGSTLNAHVNRAFVGRVVRWLIRAGIRNFLDLGSGIPTVDNVHEIARSTVSDTRVVYVDIDAVAIAHGKAILGNDPQVRAVQADLVRTAEVLHHPEVLGLLDFSQPVAVLLNAVLHFVSDADNPEKILAEVREAVAPGSYITITHGLQIQETEFLYRQDGARDQFRRTPTSLHLRTPERIRDLLVGWDLVEPGIISITDWHPEPDDSPAPAVGMVAAVARKP